MAKKIIKKSPRKAAAKKRKQPAQRPAPKTEIVVRVEQAPLVPTVTDLAEPMREGKKLTIPKTWLNEAQIIRMVQKTPREHVYRRPGKGGQTFDYVTGSYIEKVLNFVFAWNWDFEIVEHGMIEGHIWVKGRLTVRGQRPGETISKMQFGRAEVKYLKGTKTMLDYGNDLKAASTDALKKCASLLGIASDIYGKAEYKQETGTNPLPPADPMPSQGKVYEEPSIKQGAPLEAIEDHVCQTLTRGGCGADLTKQEAEYSKRMYGRELCRNHYPKK